MSAPIACSNCYGTGYGVDERPCPCGCRAAPLPAAPAPTDEPKSAKHRSILTKEQISDSCVWMAQNGYGNMRIDVSQKFAELLESKIVAALASQPVAALPTYSVEAIEAQAARNMTELQAKFPNDPDAQIRACDAEIERQLIGLAAAFPVAALPAEQVPTLPPLPQRDGDWAGDDWFSTDTLKDYARAAQVLALAKWCNADEGGTQLITRLMTEVNEGRAARGQELSDIDKENLRTGQEIQRAAGELPEGWNIEIDIECGYGGVKLYDANGEKHTEYDAGEQEGLSNAISHAIDDAAIAEKAS